MPYAFLLGVLIVIVLCLIVVEAILLQTTRRLSALERQLTETRDVLQAQIDQPDWRQRR